jgi:CBS domain-containing protein
MPTKWLIVAAIPTLVGLVAVACMGTLGGSGTEVETILQRPVGEIALIASNTVDVIQGDEKAARSYLDSLPPEYRKAQRLSVDVSQPPTFTEGAVYLYLDELKDLQFIDIKDEMKRFKGLIPIDHFRPKGITNRPAILRFIQSINPNTLPVQLGSNLINEYLSESVDLLEALDEVRRNSHRWLPVVSAERVFLGIITESLIEKKITDGVISIQNRSA